MCRWRTTLMKNLAADRRLAREKAATDAWRRVTEQNRLAGQLARTISEEADLLRTEYRSWHSDGVSDRVESV